MAVHDEGDEPVADANRLGRVAFLLHCCLVFKGEKAREEELLAIEAENGEMGISMY